MTDKTKNQPDPNLIGLSAAGFGEYYNRNVPNNFPHATPKALAEFHKRYPALFKDDDKWIINKHRKKFMDWLVSYREN